MKQKILLITVFMLTVITAQSQTWFGPQQVIISDSTAAMHARSVFAADIDGDGDMDMLSASSGDDKIAWYENTDGQGTFGSMQVITTNADDAASVYATDIDADGDQDVFSASVGGNKITWYKNMTTVGIETITQNDISIYPNPTSGKITFDFTKYSIQQLKITDLTGKTMFEKKKIQSNETFDLSGLPAGIYILSVQTEDGLLTRKVVKE